MPDESFDELMKKADNGELTQDKMEEIIREYAQSVREEFKIAAEADPDNIEEYARDFGRKHAGEALAQIHFLMHNADSETVKMNAAKYIVGLATDESSRDGDPVKQIVKELMGATQNRP